MKYRVLRPLPHGDQPGDIVDLHPDIAAVFISAYAVEPYEEPKAKEPPKGKYRRQDLRAEDSKTQTIPSAE